jgi:hypothetical protein
VVTRAASAHSSAPLPGFPTSHDEIEQSSSTVHYVAKSLRVKLLRTPTPPVKSHNSADPFAYAMGSNIAATFQFYIESAIRFPVIKFLLPLISRHLALLSLRRNSSKLDPINYEHLFISYYTILSHQNLAPTNHFEIVKVLLLYQRNPLHSITPPAFPPTCTPPTILSASSFSTIHSLS